MRSQVCQQCESNVISYYYELPSHALAADMLSPAHAANGTVRFSSARHSQDGDATHGYDSSIHVASLAEKKRLWWTNALVNSLFIAAW